VISALLLLGGLLSSSSASADTSTVSDTNTTLGIAAGATSEAVVADVMPTSSALLSAVLTSHFQGSVSYTGSTSGATLIARLRRDGISGAILQTATCALGASSSAGTACDVGVQTYSDGAPTTGHYVLTIQYGPGTCCASVSAIYSTHQDLSMFETYPAATTTTAPTTTAPSSTTSGVVTVQSVPASDSERLSVWLGASLIFVTLGLVAGSKLYR
jgi:hypothetical protein